MLPALVFLALTAFAVAMPGFQSAGRAATLHLLFAVGALPLILGAMGHFIPVLTRSRAAPPLLTALPLLALAAGALALVSLAVPAWFAARHAGATLGAAAALAMLVWSRTRRRTTLGRPHPGLAWYEAALACLALALLAILASAVWPEQRPALRRLHLHLNTLGFIGLTALGTLAVLMPTAAATPDPQAGPRLRRNLPWAAGGTLAVAVGAAASAPLAFVGAALWAVPLARQAAAWRPLAGAIFAWHGAPPLLAAALTGFAASLVFGAAAALAVRADPEAAFVTGFLLPLVSGAASQLLPTWLRPGAQGEWHATLRARLTRYGGVRAVLFLIAGLAAGSGQTWSLALAAAALIWFIVQAAVALARSHPLPRRPT
jgi:hypothetical protein